MPFPPAEGRVHEACGVGAYFFAATLMARLSGAVFWLRGAWVSEQIHPVGLSAFADPARLTTVHAGTHKDCFAATEEALREPALPLVVVELAQPLTLTQGRRLQLAAKAGQTTGLCLIPEAMGSNAAETRWRCAPVFGAEDSTRQRWEFVKNKSGTLRAWHVCWDAASRCLTVGSSAGN